MNGDFTSVAVNTPKCVRFYTCSSQHGIFLRITDGILPFDIHTCYGIMKRSLMIWNVHLNMDQNIQSSSSLQVNHSNIIIMYSDRNVGLGSHQATTMIGKKNKKTRTPKYSSTTLSRPWSISPPNTGSSFNLVKPSVRKWTDEATE